MEEKSPYTYKREKRRFSIRKTKAWGACSVFLGTSILFLSAGTVARADTTADASTSGQVVKQKTIVNTESTDSAESSANSKSSTVSSPSTGREAEATTPNQTKSTATNTENSASETQSSSQNSAEESASSSSTAKAETTSASSSSAAKAEMTSASSSSAAKAETTSASNSSAAETTSASNSSVAKAETASASNSSAAETTSASNSSVAKAETASASSSAVKADAISAGGNQIVALIATNVSKNDSIVTTKFAQNYGRRVLASSVTNTGFSVSDPDYPSGMWIDPDKSHYSYEWLQAKYGGKHGGTQIVFSTNRTGDGIVYVTELSESNMVLKQYTLNQNTQVKSAIFDSTIYYNDVYFEMVRSSSNSFVTKYTASKFDNNYYTTLSYFVPKLITQTTYYVDKDGKQITDSNGNPVAAYTQKGLVGQNYTTSDVTVVNGYYAIAPANSNGVMSPYGEIGASYVKNFHDGVVITYTQTGSDGTMSASIAQNGKVLKTWTSIKPSDPTIIYQLDSTTTYGIRNPYIPQTSDIKYVYNKLGNWVVSNPDGSTTSIIYPNDPSDPTKIADSSVPDYPVIDFLPGYTPEDHMGNPLVPVDPDDRTKGYIPPIPSDNG
ncbi:YSIRK-type signal peptide-containing protein, partial [Lactobacillus delbrueckii]|uniref:YSIRK-type signal peptide-containing protein n=1 Tax=Lactobacillus delbrueckii TaxID=1584 RepID=UPI003A869F76